jgi:RimJ/RimL family protein N-acetyltransferase
VIEIRAAPPEHYEWLKRKANLAIYPGFQAIEAVDGDRIVGMVGYDGWTTNSCCMHVALDTPGAARRILRPAFGVPFTELGKGVVFATVLSTNKRALALDLHLGFKQVALLRDAFVPGVDTHILEMRREDCRWIEGR